MICNYAESFASGECVPLAAGEVTEGIVVTSNTNGYNARLMKNGQPDLGDILDQLKKQEAALAFLMKRVLTIECRVSSIVAFQPDLHAKVPGTVDELRKQMMAVMERAVESALEDWPGDWPMPKKAGPSFEGLFSNN